MRFWKSTSGRGDHAQGHLTKPRFRSKRRGFQLEHLEERTLLSTYTISEFYFFGNPAVSETVDNVTTDYYNPPRRSSSTPAAGAIRSTSWTPPPTSRSR
jgi:hypothetical protein